MFPLQRLTMIDHSAKSHSSSKKYFIRFALTAKTNYVKCEAVI